MIIDFSRPIMEAEPGGPPDIEALRRMMSLAEICWNAPV
jgi:hypothetical protein